MTTDLHTPKADPAKRKRLLTVLFLILAGVGLAWGVHWFIYGRTHEGTDDAYVTGNLIRITPRVAGTVAAVLADGTERVKQGQVLVRLDDTDARLTLHKAEANLGETIRRISQTFADRARQAAAVAVKERNLKQAEADLVRREHAVVVQAVSVEDVEHARSARDEAQSELELARAQLAAADAAVAGTTVKTHPAVKAAEARLREAWLALQRCVIRAPSDGEVAKRSVQIGQQVTPGMPLMALVPLHQLWVEANFKEDQLKGMTPGQPVQMTSDLYGGSFTFHGTVVGLSAGTGSVFSLLPPQNATGNWIKIVQRLPVRIALEPKELVKHPLRVGLSMRVEVNTGAKGSAKHPVPAHYEAPMENANGADALIRSILKANLGHRG